MEKLPSTSYVRMVDIWLIFGQLIPFIQANIDNLMQKTLFYKFDNKKVVLFTIIEMYRESDFINHHGHMRTVEKIKSQVQF